MQAGAQVSNTPAPVLLKNIIIIKVFPLDLKANNNDQELFGVRGLNEAVETTLALCGSSAVLWLLIETDENTQSSLTAFDLSLQVIYMSVSGLCVLLSMTPMGKELRLQAGCLYC